MCIACSLFGSKPYQEISLTAGTSKGHRSLAVAGRSLITRLRCSKCAPVIDSGGNARRSKNIEIRPDEYRDGRLSIYLDLHAVLTMRNPLQSPMHEEASLPHGPVRLRLEGAEELPSHEFGRTQVGRHICQSVTPLALCDWGPAVSRRMFATGPRACDKSIRANSKAKEP